MSTVESWMRGLAKGLNDLPDDVQDDILAEVRAHIADRMSQGLTAEQALSGFGEARTFAARFRDDVRLDSALAQHHATQALIDLLTTAARSFTAGFSLVTSALCLLLALRIVGLFGEKLGLMQAMALPLDPAAFVPDLGMWLWPSGIVVAAALWLIARTSLKLAVASLRMERFA